jgi:hypothetical protein
MEQYKQIDEATIKEVEEAIKKARFEGFQSEDGFLLATGFLLNLNLKYA